MRERITITSANYTEQNELLLHADSQIDLTDLEPVGQMLVDSDHIAFVYLAEKNNDYTYIVLKDELWGHFKQALDGEGTVYVTNGKNRLELSNFLEELNYLTENIKGNSNYGEEMVGKVEAHF